MAKDKTLHFLAGVFITLAVYSVTASVSWAFGLAVLAGIAKEVYDYISGRGTVEFLDFIATLGGGLIVTLIIMMSL